MTQASTSSAWNAPSWVPIFTMVDKESSLRRRRSIHKKNNCKKKKCGSHKKIVVTINGLLIISIKPS